MTTFPRWTEPVIVPGLAADPLSAAIERLRGTPERIAALIHDVSRDVLTRRIDGKWSILENIGHLEDLEALSERRLDDFEVPAPGPAEADAGNRPTRDVNHNARPPLEVLEGFRMARERFLARLEALPVEARLRSIPHPRLFRPMRLADLVQAMAEHDEHHLARVEELLLQMGSPPA